MTTTTTTTSATATTPTVNIYLDKSELSKQAAMKVIDIYNESIEQRDVFTVAISGGSLPSLLESGLTSLSSNIDYSKWVIFFADERHVTIYDDDSNYKECYEKLFSKVGIKPSQIFTINSEVSVSESAKEYEQSLINTLPLDSNNTPVFDVILLGMGPDGHTCSLFPGHTLLNVTDTFVAAIEDSPKPPSDRITLTYPVLNASRNIVFIAAGESKAVALKECVDNPGVTCTAPAGRITGHVMWYVDEPAASML